MTGASGAPCHLQRRACPFQPVAWITSATSLGCPADCVGAPRTGRGSVCNYNWVKDEAALFKHVEKSTEAADGP